MKLDILNKAMPVARKVGFAINKHSPEICQVVGGVGMVVTIVMACRATLKLPEKTDILRKRLDRAKSRKNTPEEQRKEITKVYASYAWDIAKLYGPTAMLGCVSFASMCAATQILRNRNASLAAAYASTNAAFTTYRKRVAERFGEEVDKQLKFGSSEETVKEKETDEDGKEKTVKKKLNVIDSKEFQGASPYARMFDETNPYFQPDNEYNIFFLRQVQKYFNDRLRADGFVYLNDVYRKLGLERTKAGQIVGWVYDKDNPIGDNWIDFGLDDVWHKKTRDFINGYEPAILLDFNVDGNILELMA